MMRKSDNSFSSEFEGRVKQALADFLKSNVSVGAAVSGGADSVSLLVSLVHILGPDKIKVITVNHNLRPEKETAGDADYVASLCEKFGVSCSTITLGRGEIEEAAKKNGWSGEEAARIFRYKAFDDFIKINNIDFLCLAHNRNDNLETILMRFFQGSGSESGGGISPARGKYVRPLINISRADIEHYLNEQKISWRTDATNSDVKFLRNRIRNIIVPLLEKNLPGWQRAVLSGAEKAREDNRAISAIADKIEWQKKNQESIGSSKYETLFVESSLFYKQSMAVERRLLYKAFSEIGAESRVPFSAVRTVMSWKNIDEGQSFSVSASGITISLERGIICVKKTCFTATESGFLDILEDEKRCCRSIQSGDKIRAKDGSMRSVSGIFSAWHVKPCDRNKIKIIQSLDLPGRPLVAILGSDCGYYDWKLDDFCNGAACHEKK